jgi:hypothetical protein
VVAVVNAVNWDTLCSKCIYGTQEGKRTNSKGRCTNKKADVQFVSELKDGKSIGNWICNSFTRRWETKEDLLLSREHTNINNGLIKEVISTNETA